LLLSPFLTGMMVSAVRAGRRQSFGELVHGGVGEYWRMFRLLLWALVPFGIALLIGGGASHAADKHAEAAVLQSSAESGRHAASILLLVLLVLAHASVESARAHFAADPNLRSATRALGRGVGMLFRRPLATLGMYLGTSIIGYALVLLLGMWRIRTDAVGIVGVVLAFVLTQLVVAVLAWQRAARLYGLTAVAQAGSSRRSAYASLATA
jgi:hypothetical protein